MIDSVRKKLLRNQAKGILGNPNPSWTKQQRLELYSQEVNGYFLDNDGIMMAWVVKGSTPRDLLYYRNFKETGRKTGNGLSGVKKWSGKLYRDNKRDLVRIPFVDTFKEN